MRRKRHEQGVPASGDPRITPVDVQQVEFRLAFRGYNERDVDAFLDRITEDLSAYLDELQVLRGAGGSAVAAVPAGADAQEVLARAREEAAAIVRRAEEEAAAVRSAAAVPGSGDTRAAVAPFLNREREFLQSLGTLVQDHAAEIKQMVLAVRARADEGSGGPTATPALAAADPGEEPSSGATDGRATSEGGEARREAASPATASEIADRLGMSATTSATDADQDAEPEPIVLESSTEPVFSSEGAPVGEGRERSLRELFWGED
jgi:DivIVA domain-containing protein